MPTLTIIIQHSFGHSRHSNPRGSKNKGIQTGKQERKFSVFCRWHDTMHRIFWRYYQNLLEVISEFSKITQHRINTQESLDFLYTNNQYSEREIKESIPFTIATKWIKFLGINLPYGDKRTVHRKL